MLPNRLIVHGDVRISSLTPLDIKVVDDLVDFIRGRGYVLDFSDREMAHFFGALGLDINEPTYAESGTSKGNRLRTFLRKADDSSAVRVLAALWDHRVSFFARTGQADPIPNAEVRYLTLVGRLGGQPGKPPASVEPHLAAGLQDELRAELLRIRDMLPQSRGYAFEAFLKRAFEIGGMSPREPFSNSGEQIDGSFLLDGEVYLLEAKWRDAVTNAQALNAFHGKLEGKAAWARGLFVSFNGYSHQALNHFVGRRAILMDGRDIYDCLERRISIMRALQKKVRAAAETGKVFVPTGELFPF